MASASTASRAAVPLPLSGAQRLFAFASLLCAVGTVLWLGPLHHAVRPTSAPSIPWWAELGVCYVCGLLAFDVGVRRLTISLAELPVALGLFLVDPWVLLGCYTVGSLLAHWTRRGLQPSRDYGNLMLDVLFVAAALLTFDAMHPAGAGALAPRSVVALVAAMAVAGCMLAPAALALSIAVYRGRLRRADALFEFVTQPAGTLISTSLALILLGLISVRAWLIAAVLPPALLVIALQRTAGSAQRRAERIELRYRLSEILARPQAANERAGELLAALGAAFDAGTMELVIAVDRGTSAVRFVATGRGGGAQWSRNDLAAAELEALRLAAHQRLLTVAAHDASSSMRSLAVDRRLRSCTLVPLRAAEQTVGLLILQREPSPHEHDRLLEAASLIGAAAERGALLPVERRRAGAGDTRRPSGSGPPKIHDRSSFVEALNTALNRAPSTRRPLALLLIDLDAFLGIRGTYGDTVGESVLTTIAKRLQRHMRRYDVVGRIGHDQLGVLLDGLREHRDAEIVGTRVLRALQPSIELGRDAVSVGASVGIAVVDDFDDVPGADELLRRADMAVYLAKRQPGARCLVFDSAARHSVLPTMSR